MSQDPHTCCQDGGRDEVADVCAEKWGLKGNPPPDMETAAVSRVFYTFFMGD